MKNNFNFIYEFYLLVQKRPKKEKLWEVRKLGNVLQKMTSFLCLSLGLNTTTIGPCDPDLKASLETQKAEAQASLSKLEEVKAGM